jgi:hypothetical protein
VEALAHARASDSSRSPVMANKQRAFSLRFGRDRIRKAVSLPEVESVKQRNEVSTTRVSGWVE